MGRWVYLYEKNSRKHWGEFGKKRKLYLLSSNGALAFLGGKIRIDRGDDESGEKERQFEVKIRVLRDFFPNYFTWG